EQHVQQDHERRERREPQDNAEEESDAPPTNPKQGFSEPFNKFPTTLYLFGRTGREKEEWFRHFLFASSKNQREKEAETERPDRCGSRSGEANVNEALGMRRLLYQECVSTRNPSLLDYHSYMTRLLATEETSSPLSTPGGGSSAVTSPTCTCDLLEHPGNSPMAWADALIGRIFWDFLREKAWADWVSQKIQKKLNKIRLPYFMNDLTLTELDMGNSMPHITAASKPVLNHRGLWVELQLVYTGALQMTLETKFNLAKLGKEGSQETESGTETHTLRVLADSDEESSSAGSSDEEELLPSETGRKILKFMDKITKSKYFQKATENEFIRKKFEEMSNTPLLLTVEVQELSGTLVINIPPPPTDRIWYSFCVPPKLDLHVRPKLGEREVTFCHITEWIERKLQDEFQKVFVLPNMDDIYLPLMYSGMSVDSAVTTEKIPPEIHRTESEEERS
uniref:Testis-expressed protein 2-like n=1 Tax=Cynoglossus semilaevis TaxID=244447 RepID=A0A3P8UFV7_CYNSE